MVRTAFCEINDSIRRNNEYRINVNIRRGVIEN